MRVNIYAEEMTDRVEIIRKTIDGEDFTGIRFYLYLPVTKCPAGPSDAPMEQLRGPFIHRPGDDDSSAITFWGKNDLRDVLKTALAMLEDYYETRDELKELQVAAQKTALEFYSKYK